MKQPLRPLIPAVLILIAFTSACGILFGNVKPLEERSEKYLTGKLPSGWKSVPQETSLDSGNPDVLYEHDDGSTLAIQSVCKTRGVAPKFNLYTETRELLNGFSSDHQSVKKTKLDQMDALETTFVGETSGKAIQVLALVASHDACLYQILYLSTPEHYRRHEPDVTKFITDFRLR